eukprot:1498576-Prymnesium_polylepis.1
MIRTPTSTAAAAAATAHAARRSVAARAMARRTICRAPMARSGRALATRRCTALEGAAPSKACSGSLSRRLRRPPRSRRRT